jgi:hypothetical protein
MPLSVKPCTDGGSAILLKIFSSASLNISSSSAQTPSPCTDTAELRLDTFVIDDANLE